MSDLTDGDDAEERSVLDEEEGVRDLDDDIEEGEGEDLFGDTLEAYVVSRALTPVITPRILSWTSTPQKEWTTPMLSG